MIIEKVDYVEESEPNDQSFQANEISESDTYKARISKPLKDKTDKDVFKIWKPAGTVITFEFESDNKDFFPYIGHTDNLSHAQFVTKESPAGFRASFITSVDGWQYFEIGDKRNTSGETDVAKGGYDYYFRILSNHICDSENYELLNLSGKVQRSFRNNESGIDILSMDIEETGIYQIRINTEKMVSDKFTFVFNCDAGRVVSGNDDEDYYSGLMDPVIYSGFENNLENLVVTARLLTDLDVPGIEEFSVKLEKQLAEKELEPNNLYNYANIVEPGKMNGELSSEDQLILGNAGDDQDWFRLEMTKGEVFDFAVKSKNGETFISEMWVGSYSETGTTVIPLRFNRLSGTETHRMNMMMPFSGTGYLLLEGKNVPYTMEISKYDGVEQLLSMNGISSGMIEPDECQWHFFKWNMPPESDIFEISLESLTNEGGIHIFDSDHKPFAFLEPSRINRFFVRRYEKTETLYFGIYFNQCEQSSDETMSFKILPRKLNFTEWEDRDEFSVVKVSDSGSYQGFFDTDELFVENFFEITAMDDGILYLSTSPFRENTSFDIDTVVTLYDRNGMIAQNDDAIGFINYNKYSFLKAEVKKGEKYLVKVMPFMTESSHIPSMKITGYYILDIIIK